MAVHTPTRRRVLGAIVVAPALLATLPALAAPSSIEQLWSEMKAHMLTMVSLDTDDQAATSLYYLRLTDLEQAIADASCTGGRSAEIRLWLALEHSAGWGHFQTRETEYMIAREDAATLRRIVDDLDFDAKCIAQALLALRGEA